MLAAIPPLTPESASDAQLAQYADYYLEYDSLRRVTKETVNAGLYPYTFAYYGPTSSSSSGGISSSSSSSSGIDPTFNQWVAKTIETLPDGNQNIVYTNIVEQIILKVFSSSEGQWYEYNRFDDMGRIILTASSAAVAGYSETNPYLVTLRLHDGLITLLDYSSANPAQPLVDKKIQQGSLGDPILLFQRTYSAASVPGGTMYKLASEIIYQSDTSGGSPPATTSYAYLYYTGTGQLQQKTTTWPIIPETIGGVGQNGSGTATSRVEIFDIYGRRIWLKDEGEFISNWSYDNVTGGLVQMIEDVDTTLVAPPSGWPMRAGLNLVTDYTVDGLGREIQELGPSHPLDIGGTATTARRAKWTIYDDAGWQRGLAAWAMRPARDRAIPSR